MFLRTAIFGTLCKLRSQVPVQPRCWRDRIARPVQNGNWYRRLAQCVCDTDCTPPAQILTILTVVGTLLCYTLLQECNMIIPGTSLKYSFCSLVLYATCFTADTVIKHQAKFITKYTLYILWTVHRDTHTWEVPTRTTLIFIMYF